MQYNKLIAVLSENNVDFFNFVKKNKLIRDKNNIYIDTDNNLYSSVCNINDVKGWCCDEIIDADFALLNRNYHYLKNQLKIRQR